VTGSRTLHRLGLPIAVAIVLAVVAAACGGGGDAAGLDAARPSSRESGGVTEGDGELPSSRFELSDGTTVTFADLLDGRPLVVNFFASGCAPCRAELPDFAAVHARAGDRVSFVGLALQDTPEASAELVELTGVDYPWGLDPDAELFVAFGGFAMPTTVYISADGEVVGQDNGAIDDDTLRDRVHDLFGVAV
jgi:thiol-disulfide isomerase/thioredoxin